MRKQNVLAWVTSVVLAGFAETWTDPDTGYTWTYSTWISGGESVAEISNCSSKEGEVIIPSLVNGCHVVKVADVVFANSSIRSINVPSSVWHLGRSCFSNCEMLETIVLPATLDSLAFGAQGDIYSPFYGCENIKNIVWPGITSIHGSNNIVGIAACRSITNIVVATGTSNVVSECFSRCYSALNIIIPDGVTNVASKAFAFCRQLPHIVFPDSLQNIGSDVFQDCYNLTNVTFLGNAPVCEGGIFENANRDLVVYVPVGSKGWDGNPESTTLPKYWPYNTEGGRRIVHIGETVNYEPPVVTNYIYSTVTNYVFSTVTNEVFHYSTVTNEIFHYTTVTNVVKYVPEPGASPDAGYGINVGAGSETVIAGAAGWDAFGVPDGMEWNKETGTLSGRAKLSGAYDLILVSGSGADTKIMRTTLTIAPYDTIVGYVGVAFSQSGAPLDNLKSYKTLPAGLKWVSGVLNGVPTKAQTLDLETVDGEPVEIEIKALPDSVVGTFDGCVYLPPSNPTNGVANTCDILGTITLSATAAGKISASVKTAKKTYSFSMASWTKFAEGDAFTLEASAELKTGEVLEVNATVRDGATTVLAKLSGGEFGGSGATALPEDEDDGHAGRVTLPGCVTMLVKDVYAKNGSKWTDEDAHALMVRCAGTYQFGFDVVEEDDEGGHAGRVTLPAWTLRPVTKAEASFLKVVLKDTGVATITGTLPDKTKITLSAKVTASSAAGLDKVQIKIISAAFSGKTITLPLEVNLMNDGSPVEGHANCGIIYSVMR